MPDLLLELPSSLENTLTHLRDAVSGCAELARLSVMFERSGMFACGAIGLAQFPVRRPGAPCPVLLRDFSSGQTSCRPRRSPSRSSCPSASVPPSALAATPSDRTYASFRPHTVGTAHNVPFGSAVEMVWSNGGLHIDMSYNIAIDIPSLM